MRIRCLPLALAAAVGCGVALCPRVAHAQCGTARNCVATCPKPPAGNCAVLGTPQYVGTPITRSNSGHYFDTYTTSSIPLLGQSYEYVCHFCAPDRDSTQCTLNTFHDVFGKMQQNGNNVIRLETIFNHSPARSAEKFSCPFCDEQPFEWTGSHWDLTKVGTTTNNYLTNLDAVVCDAYNRNIIVEVTLFNPWDGDWTTGPFNQSNTVKLGRIQPGFTQRKYFASFDHPADSTDVDPVNKAGRKAQILALQNVVRQLKKYPNVIWEIANEPDFGLKDLGISPAQVFAWEQAMIKEVVKADPSASDSNKAAHLIELEGHTVDTFAWTPPGPGLPVLASIESAHYTSITTQDTTTLYGAIALWQPGVPTPDPTIVAGLASMPVAFNEGVQVPDLNQKDLNRADTDVRSEALEFIMHGGALFDGYSLDNTDIRAKNVSQQLGQLANFLLPQNALGVNWLDAMVPADCNIGSQATGNWCSLDKSYGAQDQGDCPFPANPQANLYYSTIQQPGPYLGLTVGDHLLYVHHGIPIPGLKRKGGYSAIPCSVSGDPTKGYHLGGLTYLPQVKGCYLEYWLDPATGLALHFTTVEVKATPIAIAFNPTYAQDIVLFVQLLHEGSCSSGPALTSSFSYTCNHLDCTFDGRGSTPQSLINTYTWRWGNGTFDICPGSSECGPMQNPPGPLQTVHHHFGKTGKYVVSLTVGDAANDLGVSGQQISANSQAASPSFAASCSQVNCTFDGSASTPGDAPISLYSWSFGDAAFADGVIAPAHSYAGGGSYRVTLTVTDSDGVMATTMQTVAVTGPPVANFTANCSVLTCSFDASSTSGDSPIVTYAWTFGDGTNGSGVAPTHTYAAGGIYTVTLTATDANGQSGMATGTVTADAPPTANFTVACVNRTCTVHSTSNDTDSTPVSRWLWNWGDGTPTIEPTTPYPWADQTHTYAASGRYTITHTVYDTAGLSGSLQLAVLANTPPVAANDAAATDRDVPVTIDVLANDSDPDNDPLSISGVDILTNYPGAAFQVVQLGSRWALKVTPPGSFVGTMTFTYQACDNWGACASRATVTLTVRQWTVIVDALGEQFTGPLNLSIRIPLGTLLSNDYADLTPLTIVAFDTSILMGTLDCTTDPTACTYRPPTNATGYTLFRYTVSDPAGHRDTATVRIYVAYPYNRPPTAYDDYFTTTRNAAKTIWYQDIVQNDVDLDGDTLTVSLPNGARDFGSIACSTPFYRCTYTPNAGFVGTDRFLYTASDTINPPATGWINVLTLPPTTATFDAREDGVVTAVNQNAFFSNAFLTSNDYSPNGYPITVTSIDTTGLIGSLACDSFGCTYTPPYYFQGATRFKYTASDGHGATDAAFVKIRVGGTNHAPVAVADTLSTPKNTALRFSVFDLLKNDYDPDNDPLTASVYSVTAHLGTLNCGTPNYWCVYTPNANATGADVITYLLSDGSGGSATSTVTINITP